MKTVESSSLRSNIESTAIVIGGIALAVTTPFVAHHVNEVMNTSPDVDSVCEWLDQSASNC